ncbi:hypothetical protein AB0I28_19400 [Phytomonospora sp. NPDC050363]|uniref:hypothetical protein n=1 Tax=Phytomonospora sp. NPDC050363 TaxID=3155642 RepID=UPI0033C25354
MTSFRSADHHLLDPGALHAPWARMPVLWWRDVPLAASEPVELTPLDRFVIEAAMKLGRLGKEDFELFTGLPQRVFGGLARRLWSLNMVELTDGIITTSAGAADGLADGTAPRTRDINTDLLFLPYTDDLIAVEGGLGDFERAIPRTQRNGVPLPDRFHGLSRHELLRERVRAGSVLNLPAGVTGPANDSVDEPLDAMAGVKGDPTIPLIPTIECSITVPHDLQHPHVILELTAKNASARLDVGAPAGLIRWLTSVDRELQREPTSLRPLGAGTFDSARLRYHDLGRWSVQVDGREASRLAELGSLTAARCIDIRKEDVRLLSSIALRPSDPAAEELFALDEFLDRLLGAPDEVYELAKSFTGDRAVLRRRAWTLGHFWIVHVLREAEDFAYG